MDIEEVADRRIIINDILGKLGISKFKNIPCMTVEDALADSNTLFVDVRSDEEIECSMIPNSITRAVYESDKSAYADKKLVVYDTVGYVSAGYACYEIANGFTNVAYLSQGIIGYTLSKSEEPLTKPDGTTTMDVHTFMAGMDGLIADNFNAVSFPDAQVRLLKLTEEWNMRLATVL